MLKGLSSIVKSTAFLIFLCLNIFNSWAKEITADSVYTVQKGDTLWDIADKFLEHPWSWKQIWHANPEIENPHWIYPGDRLVFEHVDGKDRIRLVRSNGVLEKKLLDGTVKLSPRIRKLAADKAIPTIPLNVIGPFLNDSRVTYPDEIERSGEIIALDEDHLVVGQGDRVYISSSERFEHQKTYLIIRPGKPYKNPITGDDLGIEGELLGRAKLEQLGHPSSFILTKSFAEVKIGDRLIESDRAPVSPYFFPKQPNGDPSGQIISVHGGLNQIGQYQVVTLTGGQDKVREIGDVLSVFQKQKDLPSRLNANKSKEDKPFEFPTLSVGKIIVFRVFDKVSYGLVLNATRPIYLLDEVGKP
jgi:hypothetical protein